MLWSWHKSIPLGTATSKSLSLDRKRKGLSWICRGWAETVTWRIPKKRFEANEVTRTISKELNFSHSRFARIRSIARRTIFSPSIPKTVAFVSYARQKKVHLASWIFRPNPYPPRLVTYLQPGI